RETKSLKTNHILAEGGEAGPITIIDSTFLRSSDCAVETHPTGTEFGVDIDRFSQEVGYRVATDIEQVSYAEITEIGDRSIVTRLKHRDTVVEAERIACEGEGIDAADQNLEHLSRRRRRDDDFLSRQSFFVVIEDRQAIEGIG